MKRTYSCIMLIGLFLFYPSKGMEEDTITPDKLPNEMVLAIYEHLPQILIKNIYGNLHRYKSENTVKNILALVCHAWHEKAVILTTCLSSPSAVSFICLEDGETHSTRIPQFPNVTRLNLNNNTKIDACIFEDILCFNLKVLSASYSNTLSDEHVRQLTTLETLKLESSLQITGEALEPLIGLNRLKVVDQSKVTIDSFQHLTNLTRLFMRGSYVVTSSVLGNLTTLQTLSLKDGYTTVEKDENLKDPYEASIYSKYNNLADFVRLPNLTHLTLTGSIVISEEALTLFSGRLGDTKLIRKVPEKR